MKTLVLFALFLSFASSLYIRKRREAPIPQSAASRNAGFSIHDRYPRNPEIVLNKDITVTFNCSSRTQWYSCDWKAPFTNHPCGLVEGDKIKGCESWESGGNFQGMWTCRLENQEFIADKKDFTLKYLKPAVVDLKVIDITKNNKDEKSSRNGKETELQPGDKVDILCDAKEALPEPTIVWYLGPQVIDFGSPKFREHFELVDKSSGQSGGTFSSMQKIRYTAVLDHNSRYISCSVKQFDDEGHENNQRSKDVLSLLIRNRFKAPEQSVNVAMIGSIIGFIIILCLVLLLLCFAWRTKKFCFQTKETFAVRDDPYCAGCRDTNPLLSQNHTCEIATQRDGPDDPVNNITKYQTEIILVTDKLVGNPGSGKTVDEFDKLTQHLEGMMQGMASKETDEGLKNRFLMAAQGLTSSVGALMGAAEKSAASPQSEEERRLARNAGEEVKSTVTQSVDIVRRIHAMKDLRSTAEQTVRVAKEHHDVAGEAVNADPGDHVALTEACEHVNRATGVLEKALEVYIQNPTSARAQTNLLLSSREFLQPAAVCVDNCSKTASELADANAVEKLTEVLERFAGQLRLFESTVEDTELCVDSIATEEAAETVRGLLAELEAVQEQAAKGDLTLPPGQSANKAAAELEQQCGIIRAVTADCLVACLGGDRPSMDKAAGELVDILDLMKTSARNAASAENNDKIKQKAILDNGLAVLEHAEVLLTAGRKTVLNPANPVAACRLVEVAEDLSQAVTSSLLMWVPGGNLKNSQHVAKDLDNELKQFKAAVDSSRIKAVAGLTLENISQKLNGASRRVDDNIKDLISCVTRGDEFGSQESSRYVALALDEYKNATKAVTSVMTDKDIQENVMRIGQAVILEAAQVIKEAELVVAQPANEEARQKLSSYAANLKSSMAALEQTYIYGAPGQEQFVSARNIMKHATKELQNPSPAEKKENIGQLKSRLMTSTKEIAGLAHDIQTKAHTDPGEMDGLTFLAQKYKNLATDINQLIEQTEDEEVVIGTLATVDALGHSIVKLIEGTAGHQIRPGQSALLEISNQAQAVAETSVQTLSSVNSLAKRAMAMDIITQQLAGINNNLDTTILFASAGTLNVENENGSFAQQRDEIIKNAQVLINDVQSVVSGTASSKNELIASAELSLTNMQQLAENIKLAASCVGPDNQEAQVMLLNTAKDVCASLMELISQSKTANGQSIDHPAFEQVQMHSKGVVSNITHLLNSIKTFEDESSRGTRAMESSVTAITQELAQFRHGEDTVVVATAEELIRANRAITQATSKAVEAACNGKQEDLLAVANIGRRAIAELLQTCRGAAHGCDNEDLKAETLAKGEELAVQYQQLMRSIAAGAKKETLVDLSKGIAQTATALAQLAEKLKGDNWINQDDPIIVAEAELQNAAESIEQAALKLSKLRPRGPAAEVRDLENMTFNELIIDSAQYIAKATTGLIKAATDAQRELVNRGKVSAKTVLGSEAGQWSEGLVSAARMVASATRTLCEAANNLVTGQAGEEHLIAAAKAVSKSTAQLVLACKVKADEWETSASMQGLNAASVAVRNATEKLVNAARGSIDRESKSQEIMDARVEMINADARVIKLEKEVAEARIVEAERKKQSQDTGTVSDIKRARDAENEVQALVKELEQAVHHKHRLNEKQYHNR